MRLVIRTLLLVGLLYPTVVRAQDDYNTDWLKDPYKLLLVVSADPHPLLTNTFVEQFTRDVGDSLQRDLGRTATVNTMVFRENDRGGTEGPKQMMETVITRGWTDLENLPRQINPTKVHLVRLYYVDGEYEVQSRQVDGDTGIISTLRRSRTTDRQWVIRLAALQLAQDFGQTGEIVDVNGQTLRIKMRAAGLGVPETIRIVQGEALAVAMVRRGASNYTATRLDETIAYITNIDAMKGLVTARLYTRIKDPLAKERQTVAFRVMKLGTRVTPLSIKVVDHESNPISGYSVSHFPGGFENGGAESLGTTDAQGRVVSRDPISHVAFVRVQIAGVGNLDTPVALLDDQPVIVKVNNSRDAEKLEAAKFEYERWMKTFNAIKDDFEVDFKVKYLDVRKTDEKKATANLAEIASKLKVDLAALGKELPRIENAAQGFKPALEYSIAAKNTHKSLEDSVKNMEEIVQQETNPTEDRKFYKAGLQAEGEYDFDQALENYSKSLQLNPNQPKLKKKYDRMRDLWKTAYRDNEHKDARQFAINVWSNKAKPLTWEEVCKELNRVEQYFDDLEKRKDFLTVLILMRGNTRNLATLDAAREALGNSEEAQEKQAIVEKTRKLIIDFNRRATDFVVRAQNE
jgi:hypothetical protein